MAREVANMSLDKEVREALDDFAQKLGVSRSSAANMILKAALDIDRKELVGAMTKPLFEQGEEVAAAAVDIAISTP